ncbi:MAG: class I SAM-dependent methyltransferase [Candidatus Aenigmarchaeota archaeon]|nr:class I SAM-dependent methyltransferase [Candidatus Aenigmarchaeota archaeon]
MENFDYEKYYEHYWEEEHIQRGMDYYDLRYNHIKEFIKPVEGLKVLDVGGGNGQFLEWLDVKKATVLDISKSGLKEAHRRGFKTVQADVQGKYPVPENSFDTIICFETIEHIEKPVNMLRQIRKCLKPGGTLVLGVPNLPADGIHHKKRWCLSDALQALHDAGLQVKEIKYTPGFIEKETLEDMVKLKSMKKFFIHTVAYGLHLLPFGLKLRLANRVPNRFAMIFIIKAKK